MMYNDVDKFNSILNYFKNLLKIPKLLFGNLGVF